MGGATAAGGAAPADLAAVAPVDDGHSLLARQRVDVDLVGVPAAVALLLGFGELGHQQLVVLLQRDRHAVSPLNPEP